MNKVFIVNKSGHDFQDANRFGELIFLSKGKIDMQLLLCIVNLVNI
mgnify:CR=1 FL=1